MTSFEDMASPAGSRGEHVNAAVERLVQVIQTAAPNVLIVKSGLVIRPLFGMFEPTEGQVVELTIGQYQLAVFVYQNTFEDARREAAGMPQSHQTIGADIIKFSGPSIISVLPTQTAVEQHDAMFAEAATECKASFIVGSIVPGKGIADVPDVRPLAFRLTREFSSFIGNLIKFQNPSPEALSVPVRNEQRILRIENLRKIRDIK